MEYIEKNINKILLIFLYLQPIIDVLTSFSINTLKHNISFGMLSRFIFLIFLLVYFIHNKNTTNKKENYTILFVLFIYLLLFTGNTIYVKDTSVFMYEVQNTLRTFYFPIMLILINKLTIDEIELKHIKNILIIYMMLILIPVLTNTSFNAYTQGKVGEVGWFNSANEISAIFSILFPFLFMYIIKLKNIYLKLFYTLLALFTFFVLGTKMTIISIIITITVFGIKYIYQKIQNKEYKQIKFLVSSFVILIFLTIVLVPKTNFYKNIDIHLNYLEINNISDVFKKENFDHFIFSSRLSFLNHTKLNYKESTLNEKLLGIGYIEKYGTDEVNFKLIEMDFFDILFIHGIIGFLIYISIFVYFIKQIIKDSETTYLLSMFLILFTSTLVGHVVTSPAVSIYVIIILTKGIKESYEK